MTIENWKTSVSTSSHLRKGESIVFTESKSCGMHTLNASIKESNVFLGCYIINDYEKRNVDTGWWYA